MSIISTVDYDNPANFNFDATKVEVSVADAEARLAKNPEPGSGFLATLLQIDADASADSVTGTPTTGGNGTVNVAGSAAEFRGGVAPGGQSTIQWAIGSTDGGQVGCVRCVITPRGFVDTPTNQSFFSIINSPGNNSRCSLRRVGTNLVIDIFDSSGMGSAILTHIIAGVGVFAEGVPVELEVNWDVTVGATRLFVDGVQLGSTNTNTGTRSAAPDLRGGSLDANSAEGFQNHDLNGLQVFSTVQHTANYTPTGVNLYSLDGPTVKANATVESDALVSLAQTVVIVDTDEIRWVISADGLAMWFNGAAWVTSNQSIAQSNTLADLNANVATLDISAGAAVVPVALLISTGGAIGTAAFALAGDTTPRLSQHVLTYDFFATKPDLVTCIVNGFVTHIGTTNGEEGLEGRTVTVENEPFIHGEHQIPVQKQTTVTDDRGAWEISLIETASINRFPYNFRVDDTRYDGRQVPSQFAQDFGALLTRTS